MAEDKVVHRKRAGVDMTVLHVEIETESYDYVKAIAKAKRQPMGGYVNNIIKRKIEKVRARSLEVIQNAEKPC